MVGPQSFLPQLLKEGWETSQPPTWGYLPGSFEPEGSTDSIQPRLTSTLAGEMYLALKIKEEEGRSHNVCAKRV